MRRQSGSPPTFDWNKGENSRTGPRLFMQSCGIAASVPGTAV
jgi:hypothetical protein